MDVDEEGGVSLDSLPYIDRHIDEPGMAQYVESLIREEMNSLENKDYLDKFPLPELTFYGSEILKNEFARMERGEEMEKLDMRRYELPSPAEDMKENEEAWKRAVDNARSQLEHQENRIDNLEILSKYAKNAWLAHINLITREEKDLQKQIDTIKQEIDDINRKRKKEQTATGEYLYRMETKFYELCYKNLEIELAFQKEQQRTKQLREYARRRGLVSEEKDKEDEAPPLN